MVMWSSVLLPRLTILADAFQALSMSPNMFMHCRWVVAFDSTVWCQFIMWFILFWWWWLKPPSISGKLSAIYELVRLRVLGQNIDIIASSFMIPEGWMISFHNGLSLINGCIHRISSTPIPMYFIAIEGYCSLIKLSDCFAMILTLHG